MLPSIAALKQAISGVPDTDQGLDISLDLDSPLVQAPSAQPGANEQPDWLKELDQLTEPADAGPVESDEVKPPNLPALDFDLSSVNAPLKPDSSRR